MDSHTLIGGWPPGYGAIFGALAKGDFKRPEQPPLRRDAGAPEPVKYFLDTEDWAAD